MRIHLLVGALILVVGSPPAWGSSSTAASSTPGNAPGAVAQAGQPLPGGAVVEASMITYDPATRTVTARGNVRVTHRDFRLFAEVLTFDLETQTLTAEGQVRLVDAAGREVRAERLTYRIPTREAVATGAETVIDQAYLRGERVEIGPQRVVAHEATATTCDPRRPLYRITARRIEVTPERELIATDASLWLGNTRIVTLPRYTMSLDRDDGGPAGPPLPRFGYDGTDGFWIDYQYGYALGPLGGALYLKYATSTGFFPLNTLTYGTPAWSATLRMGRAQLVDVDNIVRRVVLAELAVDTPPARLGGLPLSWSSRLAAGWFDEEETSGAFTRLDGTLIVSADPVRLSPRLTANAAVSYRLSIYGGGTRRHVAGAAFQLTYQLDPASVMFARYDLAAVTGTSPFLFDRVTPASTVTLGFARWLPSYRFSAAVSHNFLIPETKLIAEGAVRISPTFVLGAGVVYNTRTRAFEDIDYLVEYRCDCLSVTLRYRQVRREILLELSLRGGAARLPAPTEPPPGLPPPGEPPPSPPPLPPPAP